VLGAIGDVASPVRARSTACFDSALAPELPCGATAGEATGASARIRGDACETSE
jgi:hypothetical protein